MFYKNTSYSVKTFHGVTFQPGETKEVNEYINDLFVILVDEPRIDKQQKPSPEPIKVPELVVENDPQSETKKPEPEVVEDKVPAKEPKKKSQPNKDQQS